MTKARSTKQSLIQALLVSSVFMSANSAHATVISIPTAGPIFTAAAGNFVQVTSTGQIHTDGIVFDSDNVVVIMDPNNTKTCTINPLAISGCAITTPSFAMASLVAGDGEDSTITIGVNTTVEAGLAGIVLEADSMVVNNSGLIYGASVGMGPEVAGTNATITNSGIIMSGQVNAPNAAALAVFGTGSTILNSGKIFGDDLGLGVYYKNHFISLDNINGAQITSELSAALQIAPTLVIGPITGVITNSGKIDVGFVDTSPTVTIKTGGFAGTLNNLAGGEILGYGNDAMEMTANFGTINNAGTIRSGLETAIRMTSGITTGSLNNLSTGLIETGAFSGDGILLGAITIDNLNNAGKISINNPTKSAITNANANVLTIKNGLINSGTIENLANGPAISLGNASKVTLIQNTGVINRDVILAGKGSSIGLPQVLIMNGGEINGNVNGNSTVSCRYDLNGGNLNGGLSLTDNNDTVNLAGTQVFSIFGGNGNDIVNITGGNFTNITGGTGADTMNILATFTAGGPINDFDTIHVQNGSTFTHNNPIGGLDTKLTIDADSAMVSNADVLGFGTTVELNGTLEILSPLFASNMVFSGLSTVTNKGELFVHARIQPFLAPTDFSLSSDTYNQSSTGNYTVELVSQTNFGAIFADNATFASGSTIQPLYIPNDFIPTGSAFPVVETTASLTDNGVVILLNPNSAVDFFTKQIAFPQLQLVLNRRSYTSLATNSVAAGIGPTLDELSSGNGPADPELRNLLVQLERLTTNDDVSAAMQALSPDVSYSMIEAAHIGMDRNFNSILFHLEDMKRVMPDWYYQTSLYNGINSGDGNTCPYGIWVKGMGEWLDQKARKGLDGYKASAEGLVIGIDRTLPMNNTYGLAASFVNVHMVGQAPFNNVQNVSSYQLTGYGVLQPTDSIYIDAMIGASNNKYRNNRNLTFGNIVASAYSSYYAWQYGVQAEIGYVDWQKPFYITPLARVKGTYLQTPNYNEKDAGALGLQVTNPHDNVTQLQAGGGFRFAREFHGVERYYLPEISFVYLYDFANDNQQTVANFLGGGTAFKTNGIAPGRNAFLVDLGVDTYCNQLNDYVLTARYELELRDRFIAHSGYLEAYYRFL